MSINTKTQLLTFILWAVNLKIFMLISNWNQIATIFKYSNSILDFYTSLYKFYLEFVTTIPAITLILWIIFAILLYIFWFYYFKVYFHKLPNTKGTHTGYWGILASIFTFLGFGCIACGETLLTSILFLFVSNSSTFLTEFIGNLSMFLGIALICFGIYKNYKIYHNKNLCRI